MATKCSRTGKIRYPNYDEGHKHLTKIRNRKSYRDKLPVRVYHCEFCDGWHHTSKQVNTPGVEVKMKEQFKKYIDNE